MPIQDHQDLHNWALTYKSAIGALNTQSTLVKQKMAESKFLIRYYVELKHHESTFQRAADNGMTAAKLGAALTQRFGIDWATEKVHYAAARAHAIAITDWMVANETIIMATQGMESQRNANNGGALPTQQAGEFVALVNVLLADFD